MALTGHAVFLMRLIVTWATIVLFVIIFAIKLRPKVLTRISQKERRRGHVLSSNSTQSKDCSLCLTLPESVTRSDVDFIDREAWVQRMTHHVFSERHKGSHNVIVINDNLKYQFDAQGILERFLISYYSDSRAGRVPYAVVVFREGMLVNMGDGGDINWDWQGNVIRSGNKMLTFKPCVPGIAYEHVP